jgi:hypothetical protein
MLIADFVMGFLLFLKDFWLCSKTGTRCSWLLEQADPLSWVVPFIALLVGFLPGWLFVPILPLKFSDYVVVGIGLIGALCLFATY